MIDLFRRPDDDSYISFNDSVSISHTRSLIIRETSRYAEERPNCLVATGQREVESVSESAPKFGGDLLFAVACVFVFCPPHSPTRPQPACASVTKSVIYMAIKIYMNGHGPEVQLESVPNMALSLHSKCEPPT